MFFSTVWVYASMYMYVCIYIYIYIYICLLYSFIYITISQEVLVVKNTPAKAGDVKDMDSIPESERSSGEGHGNPLQHSCLDNPMDRGAWWATGLQSIGSQRVEHDQSDLTYTHTHTYRHTHTYLRYM